MTTARGSVIKRGPTWTVILDVGRDEDGKRIRRWHPGYLTRDAAEEARTDLLHKLDHDEYVVPSKLTVRQFSKERWLPSLDTAVAGGKIKPNTRSSYRTQIESYVLPRLGHVALKDVSADMLARFYGELLTSGRRHTGGKDAPKGLSPTSVRLVHITIHRMLKDAVRWGILARNVADAAAEDAPQRRKTGNATMHVWEPEQLGQFVQSVGGDRLSAMWVLFITTGLRRGEVAGLTWHDLDLTAGRLTVNQARVVVDHKVIESAPKSERSVREIGLDAATVAALKAHRARQATERLAWGPEYQATDLVFTWENGRPLHPNVISRTFTRLAEKAKLPAIRLHDLRHSYASAALTAGVGLKVVSERLGHASISITGDIYSHVSREVDQSAADRVAAVILGGGGAVG